MNFSHRGIKGQVLEKVDFSLKNFDKTSSAYKITIGNIFERTIPLILSDPPLKKLHTRFTTSPLKHLSVYDNIKEIVVFLCLVKCIILKVFFFFSATNIRKLFCREKKILNFQTVVNRVLFEERVTSKL